ncbi:MAG TPA: hypothetical protein VFH18_04920 [Erysipelotrichaceae bacterium]|nr:hypothetical protein [Erysipelotrichaceae bacterium]
MKRKIQIHIDTDEHKFHLPKVSFNNAIRLVKLGLWGSGFTKDAELNKFIKDNKKLIIQFLETMAMELIDEEAFTLVDVNTKDAIIKIDII